jgi:hypothetical protein
MKVPTAREGISYGLLEPAPRPVPRVKRSLATSFCAACTPSWAAARATDHPYRFVDGCFCLTPEQHGAQFQGPGSVPRRGNC